MRIAVLICYKSSHYNTTDHLLVPAFAKEGLIHEEVVWDDPGVDWNSYDAVIIRSTWDYIEKRERFIQVLSAITESGTPLFNPLSVVLWNSQKSYLNVLKSYGINVIDTIISSRIETPYIHWIFSKFDATEFIIKPLVSAGAYKTFRVNSQTAQKIYQEQYALDEKVLIQPFISEILNGEISFIFLDGEFSHAIKQIPSHGDFRVQYIHGGMVKAIEPKRWMIEEASRILSTALQVQGALENLLYARVDVVEKDKKLYLMELELIEPTLYLDHKSNSAEKFAKVLKKLVVNPNGPQP